MMATELLQNQIVYLTYLLADLTESVEAEILRPTWENLRQLGGNLHGPVKTLIHGTERKIGEWIQMRIVIRRGTLERLLMTLKMVLTELQSHPLEA